MIVPLPRPILYVQLTSAWKRTETSAILAKADWTFRADNDMTPSNRASSVEGVILMHHEGDEIHVNSEEASGGTQPKILRYMLAASLALAIVALSAIWMTGSFLS